MVKASCNNVIWEEYMGVCVLVGGAGALIEPSPLLKTNKSQTGWNTLKC